MSNKSTSFSFMAAVLTLSLLCGEGVCMQDAYATAPSGYTLAWSAEFNGSKLDTAKWRYRTDTKYWSAQTPGNISLSDGNLRIALKNEHYNKMNYTGGGVITVKPFRYGYYETRAKLWADKGWHQSFWLKLIGPRDGGDLGKTPAAKVEIDGFEVNSIMSNKVDFAVHRWHPLKRVWHASTRVDTTRWHVYGVEWTPGVVNYYIDNKLVHSASFPKPHSDVNIILSAIADPAAGTDSVNDTNLPGRVLYDYVRYYSPGPRRDRKYTKHKN